MFKGEEMEEEGMEGGEDIDSIMREPIEGDDEEEGLFGKEDPLESALAQAGFKVAPDVLEQVRALVSKPAKPMKPELPGKPEAGAPAVGGAVPAGMNLGDLAR